MEDEEQRYRKRARVDSVIEPLKWKVIEKAFRNRIFTGAIENSNNIKDEKVFFDECEELFVEKVHAARIVSPLKVNTCLLAKYVLWKDTEEKEETKNFATKNMQILESTDLREWYQDHVVKPILRKMSEFQERDSGWALKELLQLNVNINKCETFNGGAYIELPKEIRVKKAVVNVQCFEPDCFAWAVISALHPTTNHSERTSSYPNYRTILNLEGIKFPMDVKQIGKFERQNNLSINVYSLKKWRGDWEHLESGVEMKMDVDKEEEEEEEENVKSKQKYEVLPILITNVVQPTHINLLMIRNNETGYNHYCWIKNLSRLVSSNLSKMKVKKWICDRCLSYFYSEEKLGKHTEDCVKFSAVKCILPSEDQKWLEFRNFSHKERVPFIVYADLECFVKPVTSCERNSDESRGTSYTEIFQHHVPCSIAYYFACDYDKSLCKYNSYRGPNCEEWFAREIREIAIYVANVYDNPIPMLPMNREEVDEFERSTECHICLKNILPNDPENPKVRDHCHFTGKYRGPAHSKCNLNYKDRKIVPVVFHNLSGYDAHFIIKNLCERYIEDDETSIVNSGPVRLLPINKEKYKSFTKCIPVSARNEEYRKKKNIVYMRFIDSMNFMSASLAKLASYLCSEQLRHMHCQYENVSQEKFELLLRKGVYPYDYMDSEERFEEQSLPSIEKFFSKLTNESISNEDYEHARKVWYSFECTNLGDYSDLYLKTDVMLLADVFENFRSVCLDTYKLDPAHYVTAPSLAWDAMLSVTRVRLELLTDIDMLMFFERGIRGGLSQCSHRYAQANNKYMKNYNHREESTYLMYFDVNNLYGWAMMQNLPSDNFKWLTPREIRQFDVSTVSEDSSVGYVLEVDLNYPASVHEEHSDLPLCPESRIPPKGKNKKLLATLYDKEKYVIHYRNLRYYLSLGLEIKKIHRILSFNQSAWMRSYIELNTQKRTLASNEFEKNFYKLMNNSVFGKTMQNVRNMRDVKLVTKWEGRYGAGRLISKPNFKDRVIFDKDFAAIEMRRLKILFDKPVYVGMSILDISKLQLYSFHYDYMLPKYSIENVKVMYTDTDSLIYLIKTEDVYSDMRENVLERFDTSDYANDNPYGMPRVNKKVIGLMKDENAGKIMTKFVGLRSKMYALEMQNQKCINKAKGIKYAASRTLRFSDYEQCLFKGDILMREQSLIRSEKHCVYTVKQQKIALSPHDDKRCLLRDSTATLPWDHYKIVNDKENQ